MTDQSYPLNASGNAGLATTGRISPPRRDPFTPREPMPPSRPIAKPEEGAQRGEGLAALGSGLLVLAVAAAVSWVLYLALA